MREPTRIINGAAGGRQIFIGNRPVGYIDEDDQVIVFERDTPRLLGVADHTSEAVKMVDEWRANAL